MSLATVLRLAFAAAALAAAGCSSAKPEAAALVASVEQFHRASNEERAGRADAIARVACNAAEVCDAKSTCVEATTQTAMALRLKHEAEVVLADLEAKRRTADDPAVRELPAKLDRASRLLSVGHDAMPGCDHKILVLRERYDL
jgi:hypothetical protein